MATHSIKTSWRENNIFDTDLDGHKVTIDLGEDKVVIMPDHDRKSLCLLPPPVVQVWM